MTPGAESRILNELGEDGLGRLVGAFYRRVRVDEVLGPMYRASLEAQGEDWPDAERRLARFLCFRMGGSRAYVDERGHPRLRARHMAFAIDRDGAGRWARAMMEAVEEMGVSDESAAELRSFFEQTAAWMVNRGEG
ncbi:MAG: globin [Phycisphaerales bacterium]